MDQHSSEYNFKETRLLRIGSAIINIEPLRSQKSITFILLPERCNSIKAVEPEASKRRSSQERCSGQLEGSNHQDC